MSCFAGRFASVGFAGSRRLRGGPWRSVRGLAALAASAGASVFVGCAAGADRAARLGAGPAARVFRWEDHLAPGLPRRAAFARRSAAMIRALAAAPSPCLLVWPGRACPAGLLPSASSRACWGGFGSGSWSAAAFAAGLGLPVFVFLPAALAPPAAWPGAWSTVQAGALAGAWSWSPALAPLL